MSSPSTINSQPSTEFGDRLVTLSDGREGLRGGIHMDVREPSPLSSDSQQSTPQLSTSSLDFISSDESLDRYDEIISASGWKLANYQRNPVFQNAHKYGDIIFTLGKALVTEIHAGKLFQRIEFATDVNPMAKIAYGLYKGKFLNAVSVGFIPIKWENGTPPSGGSPGTPFRRKYLEQELLEVSAVSIPANPNALALGLKAGAIEKSDLIDLEDLLRHTLDASRSVWSAPLPSPGAFPNPSHQSHASHNSQLVAFARQLHAILKS